MIISDHSSYPTQTELPMPPQSEPISLIDQFLHDLAARRKQNLQSLHADLHGALTQHPQLMEMWLQINDIFSSIESWSCGELSGNTRLIVEDFSRTWAALDDIPIIPGEPS